jgi:hypothetical protein
MSPPRAPQQPRKKRAATSAASGQERFDRLDSTEFEEFCFEMLRDIGFVNVEWRKGTGFNVSPADRGRDIEAKFRVTDIDETERFETWFVDCKHHKRGVPPDKLQSILTWAWAERPDVVLIVASNSLANSARDYLKRYEENIRPPFRIKYWERPQLKRYVSGDNDFLRIALRDTPRTEAEILAAEQECFDKVWHERHLVLLQRELRAKNKTSPEILKTAARAAADIRKKYGSNNLGPYSEFDWGMLNGKLSTLRWVLGDDWDFLDT